MNKLNKDLNEIFKEITHSSHHAFLIETDSREKVFSFFQKELSEIKNKSDKSLFLSLQVFDIAKTKEILNYVKITFSDSYFIVISFYSINREAQNSLLKFLEEAPNNLKIILISHGGAKIVNTVYSRVYQLEYFENNEKFLNSYNDLAKKFLENDKISRIRLEEIVELLNRKDEYALNVEDKERSDRESIELFLLALYEELFLEFKKESKKEKIKILEDALKEINIFLKYIKTNSSSGKTILEYLSLKLPKI